METIYKTIGTLIRSRVWPGIDGKLSSGTSITSFMLPQQAEAGKEIISRSSPSPKKVTESVIFGPHSEFKSQAEPQLSKLKLQLCRLL